MRHAVLYIMFTYYAQLWITCIARLSRKSEELLTMAAGEAVYLHEGEHGRLLLAKN